MTPNKIINGQMQTEFVHCFFNCDTFKQKEIDQILRIIGATRLHDYMQFDGYGSITFSEEDRARRFPLITMLDENGEKLKWSRKETNCLVFNMTRQGKNNRYDKLFMYHTNSHNGNGVWYGWIAWDGKNKKSSHRFFVPHDIQDLVQALNRMIYHIPVLETNERLLKKSRINSRRFLKEEVA